MLTNDRELQLQPFQSDPAPPFPYANTDSDSTNDHTASYNSVFPAQPRIETLLEFNKESGGCTALLWLTPDVVCVGFSSGDVACFHASGRGLSEQRCDPSAVRSLRLSDTLLPGIYGASDRQGWGDGESYATMLLRSIGADGGNGTSAGQVQEPSLWVLYESGIVAVVPVSALRQGEFDELIRFKLMNTAVCCDLVLLASPVVASRNPFDIVKQDEYGKSHTQLRWCAVLVAAHCLLPFTHFHHLPPYSPLLL